MVGYLSLTPLESGDALPGKLNLINAPVFAKQSGITVSMCVSLLFNVVYMLSVYWSLCVCECGRE